MFANIFIYSYKNEFKLYFLFEFEKMHAFDTGKYYPMDDIMTPSQRDEVVRDMNVVLIVILIYIASLYVLWSNL